MKKTLAIAVLVIACLNITACGNTKNIEATVSSENIVVSDRSESEIINDIIYSFDAKADNPVDENLFNELETVNPKKAMIWKKVCDTWGIAYKDGFVNDNILPDGLPEDDSLCMVVLGFELNPDGSMKDELVGRLQVAYDSALKYPNAYILVTGGGTAAKNPSATEGDVMADWLKNQGIDEARIIVENKSLDTLANATNSLAILSKDYPSVNKLAIITSDYHVPWGTVNYIAAIEYIAYANDSLPFVEIISNAGYVVNNSVYRYDIIEKYQKDQLWHLEDR